MAAPESEPRRIFLRFRTKDDAPSDLQIIQGFYTLTGLSDADCFVHWQARENRDTYVILDVHCGRSLDEQRVQELPHEIYQLSWTSGSSTIDFDALNSEAVKGKMLKFTTMFSWCS